MSHNRYVSKKGETQLIRLGQKVKDSITGLEGIVIARTEWLHGCVRITIQPQEVKDGKPVDSYNFDEPQAIVLENTVRGPVAAAGGDRPTITRAPDPTR